jgi:hypothetical protein
MYIEFQIADHQLPFEKLISYVCIFLKSLKKLEKNMCDFGAQWP